MSNYHAGWQLQKVTRLGNSHKHARSAGTGTMGVEHCNIHWISAGKGMSLMASSMNIATDMLANAMCKVTTTLQPAKVDVSPPHQAGTDVNPNVTVAIALIESNEGLSDNKFSDAAQFITVNLMITTVYVSMNNQSVHSRYIWKQVNNYHGLNAIA